MKRRLISILLSVCTLLCCAFCLNGCKDDDKSQTKTSQITVMVLSSNPSVELIVENGKVVTATASNDEGNFILSQTEFVGLTPKQAGNAYAKVCVDNGFIYAQTQNITVEISGKQANATFDSVEKEINAVLSEEGLTISVNKDELTPEELKNMLSDALRHLNEEQINAFTQTQLYSNLLSIRKEVQQLDLNTQELKEAYYSSRAYKIISAKLSSWAQTISSLDGFIAKEQILNAIDDLNAKISSFSYSYAESFLMDGEYKTAIKDYIQAKNQQLVSAINSGEVSEQIKQNAQNLKLALSSLKEQTKELLNVMQEAINSAISYVQGLIDGVAVVSGTTLKFTNAQLESAIAQNKEAFKQNYQTFIDENVWASLQP